MDKIIGEHFSKLNNFRSFALIFDVEPSFIKINDIIFIFEFGCADRNTILLNQKNEGYWIHRYSDGQKSVEGNFRNGFKEGLWVEWYQNGQKKSEGNYQNGNKIGLWSSWTYYGIDFQYRR